MYSQSPPTKTSLVSWWKTFKMRPKDHTDLATSPTSQMLAPPGMPQGSLSPGPTGLLERPKMPHMSRSNGEWSSYNANSALDEELEESVIFGVPLSASIQYANVSISLTDPNGEQFIYGHIPIVVAKCGVYLKENATGVEGIFRVSGSAKRMRDLQRLFNTPPRYGKGLDWSGFNVHDAANVLRRYLNHLPEPIVPLEFYEQFRKPLRNSPSILEYIENKSPAPNAPTAPAGSGAAGASTTSVAASEHNASVASLTSLESTTTSMQASTTNLSLDDPLHQEIVQTVAVYQDLIARLPNLNRQLLMYILDLLAVFASKSEENLMPAPNLAAIFQPSILFHPDHDMMPREYRLSRSVIEFMIEHSNKFLSTIETIAREEHARNKELGIKPMAPSPQVSVTSTIPQDKQQDKQERTDPSTLAPPGRRHSKSMSSVNPAPPQVQVTQPQPVPQPAPAREQLVVRKPRESDREKEKEEAAPEKKEGLLNTIKRASSLSRRPSQRRTSSNSSQTSDLQRSSTINRGFRKSSAKSEVDTKAPENGSGSDSAAATPQGPVPIATAPGTSSAPSAHSLSPTAPPPVPSVHSIDSSLASQSPRVLSPMNEPKSFLSPMHGASDDSSENPKISRRSSHEKSGSPRFRVLGNVFGHSNDSASSLSGMTRSVSSSSIDGDGVGAEERPKSRWRRSFIFMQPNSSNPAIDDPNFVAPPVRSPGEVSVEDYSMSPSKLSFFKRMRSRERGSQDVERPVSSAESEAPSVTAVQAAAAAAGKSQAAQAQAQTQAQVSQANHQAQVMAQVQQDEAAAKQRVTKKPVGGSSGTVSGASDIPQVAQPVQAVKKVPAQVAQIQHANVAQPQSAVQGDINEPPIQVQALAPVPPQVQAPMLTQAAPAQVQTQTQAQAPTKAQPSQAVQAAAAALSPAHSPTHSPVQSSTSAPAATQANTPIQSMLEPELAPIPAAATLADASTSPAVQQPLAAAQPVVNAQAQ